MAKSDFERIISPLASCEVALACNAGMPLHHAGKVDRFATLFDIKRFHRSARHAEEVHVTYPDADRRSMTPARAIDGADADAHYLAGGTVCITGVDAVSLPLQHLAKTCKATLGWTGIVDCRAYLSKDGSGYTPHFDDKTVITLQIEGCKTWKVADKPAVRNPVSNAGRFPDGVYRYFGDHAPQPWECFEQPSFPDGARTYELQAGDILIVPAGVWHDVRACGHSLSIALTLNHVGSGSARDIVFSTLMEQVIGDPEWRGAAPMTPPNPLGETHVSLDALDAFFVSRLHSLRECIDRNIADRSELIGGWLRSLQQDR